MIETIKQYFEKYNPLEFDNNETIQNIQKLANGESNINYILVTNKNKYVLRFDIVGKSKTLFEQEYQILKLIEKLNISPRALFIDTSKKFFKENFMIISFVNGTPLENLKDKSYRKKYDTLAQEVAMLHKTPISFKNKEYSLDNWINMTLKEIKKLKNNIKGIIDLTDMFELYNNTFKKLYSNYTYQETFCHMDLGLLNVLFDGNKFSIIDWESAGLNDPALELTILFFEQQLNDKEQEEFLKSYLKIRKDNTIKQRKVFTDFFISCSGFFMNLNTCINIAIGIGHKDYLENANFQEYWDWNMYYFELVCKQGLFDDTIKQSIVERLDILYKELRK